MLADIAATTEIVEGKLRSPVEVLTVWDDQAAASLPMGANMRALIAEALDTGALENHRDTIHRGLLQLRTSWVGSID